MKSAEITEPPKLLDPAPTTPVRTRAKSSTENTLPQSPVKKPRSSPQSHHLHGWDDAHIPLWLKDVPRNLRRKLIWSNSTYTHIPEDAIVLLFVGDKDGGALDQILESRHPNLSERIFAIDLKRDKRFNNFRSEEPYNSLCTAAAEGRLYMVGGGPMCRTFTVLRLLQLESYVGMLCSGTILA